MINPSSIIGKLRSAIPIAAATLAFTLFSAISGRSILATAGNFWISRIPPACEEHPVLFPRNVTVPDGQTLADAWAALYHQRVSMIIDEHIELLKAGGTVDASSRTMPTGSLQQLATDMERGAVHEENLPELLLGHLDAFECTLQSEYVIAEVQISQRNWEQGMKIHDLAREAAQERRRIVQEAQTARIALHRTLVYLSGYARFQPLTGALRTLMNATVDINNNLDLAAEVSACMPARIWDAKTSLRTLPAQ